MFIHCKLFYFYNLITIEKRTRSVTTNKIYIYICLCLRYICNIMDNIIFSVKFYNNYYKYL